MRVDKRVKKTGEKRRGILKYHKGIKIRIGGRHARRGKGRRSRAPRR